MHANYPDKLSDETAIEPSQCWQLVMHSTHCWGVLLVKAGCSL